MKTGATRPNDSENLIAEAHSKIDSLYGKRYFGELQNKLTKIFVVSQLRLPPGGTLRHLYKKNISSFYLIKTKTFQRFMRHQNECTKRVK